MGRGSGVIRRVKLWTVGQISVVVAVAHTDIVAVIVVVVVVVDIEIVVVVVVHIQIVVVAGIAACVGIGIWPHLGRQLDTVHVVDIASNHILVKRAGGLGNGRRDAVLQLCLWRIHVVGAVTGLRNVLAAVGRLRRHVV